MTYAISLDPVRLYCTLPVAPIRREFARVGASAPRVCVRYTDAGNSPRDVLIERYGPRFTLVLEGTAPQTVAFAR
jgi:hypothetical protein